MAYQVSDESLGDVLGEAAESSYELIAAIRRGVHKASLTRLGKVYGISPIELGRRLPVSERTLQRYGEHQRLSSAVSDHLVQMAQTFARAREVFGTADRASAWMRTPCKSLGGETPFNLLDTIAGIELVRDELGRIDAGVYA